VFYLNNPAQNLAMILLPNFLLFGYTEILFYNLYLIYIFISLIFEVNI